MQATTLVAQPVSAKHLRIECRSRSSARQHDAKSPEVFKVLGGAEWQLTLHSYIFDMLKVIHKKDVPGLDDLCRIMAGDARTKSLNIGLRHRRVKPPSAKACPPVAPNLTADEVTTDGVHIPALILAGLPSSSSSSVSTPLPKFASLSLLVPKEFCATTNAVQTKKLPVKLSTIAKKVFKTSK